MHIETTDKSLSISRRLRSLALAPIVLVPAVTIALAATAWQGPALAGVEDPWWQNKRSLTLQERRQQRRQFNEAFTARFGPEYKTNTPYVSQQTIDGLRQAIGKYRKIVAAGGWQTFPDGMIIRPNDRGNHVAALRRHLTLTGDARNQSRRVQVYDSVLQEAVARFQMRHGLTLTGFVDSRTRHTLNISAQIRLRQLETNLIRLQDLMRINKSSRYVLVNLPSYTLQAVEGGAIGLQSKVIVGKTDLQTPSLSVKIRELNFYPYWRVPDSIARRDLIPQIRRDPDYFSKLNFRLLPTWGAKPIPPEQIDWSSPDIFKRKFRQEPGPENALGVLRINMPNKDIVYLHDTPQKQLFDRNSRAFSAGCVRVERVLDLAGWLLKDKKGWSPMRVDVTVALGKSDNVKMKKPVPVHFVYVTAWANGNGIVHFRPDIYSRDGNNIQVAEVKEGPIQGANAIAP